MTYRLKKKKDIYAFFRNSFYPKSLEISRLPRLKTPDKIKKKTKIEITIASHRLIPDGVMKNRITKVQ